MRGARSGVLALTLAVALGSLTVGVVGRPAPASAQDPDICVLLDRVIPADATITDTSGADPDHCLANLSYAGTRYGILIDRTEVVPPSLSDSIYLFARGSGQLEFEIPGLGDEQRAYEEPQTASVVIQWLQQCFVLQVEAETDIGGSRETAVQLALDTDRVLGVRDRGCPGRVSAPASSTTTTTSLPGGRPLCVEARALAEGFSTQVLAGAGITDPLRTSIVRDDDVLLPDFQKAIADWDAYAPGARSYAKDGIEAVTNILWVARAKEQLPENGTRAFRRSFVTGKEQPLVDTIRNVIRTRRGRNDARRLTPGDVFALAIELHEGDVTEALLTVHNTMRGLAGETGVGVNDGVGEDFFDDELAPLRGSDNANAAATLFGAAYLEMSVQGSWGSAVSEFAVKLFSENPVFLELLGDDFLYDKTKEAIQDQGRTNAGSSLTSRVANAFARFAGSMRDRPADPEAFCFGVWGAQIGKALYDALPYAGTRALSEPPFSDLELPDDDELPDVGFVIADRRQLNVLHSPFSVQWSGSGAMLFDQGATLDDDARVSGDAPSFFVAFPDGESWGAVWLDAPGSKVTLEAMVEGGVLHYHQVDLTTGATAYWEAVAPTAGDRFTLTSGATPAESTLIAPDGTVVTPLLFDLAAAPVVDSFVDYEDDGSSPVIWILAGVAAVAVAGALWWWRRRSASARGEASGG